MLRQLEHFKNVCADFDELAVARAGVQIFYVGFDILDESKNFGKALIDGGLSIFPLSLERDASPHNFFRPLVMLIAATAYY